MELATQVLDFWFGSPDSPNYGKPQKNWFAKNPEFDREIEMRFLQLYEQAASGLLDGWKITPPTCLALIILLDQFPRNLFRGTPAAFATDWDALSTANFAIDRGYDQDLLPVQRWFIYLPFEHSENLDDQNRAVKLFQQLSDDPDSISTIEYALRHREIIENWSLD